MSRTIIVDGRAIPARDGESVLLAMLRAGLHPTGGGCLCLSGDCSHCLATIAGEPYVRSCQVEASPELRVDREHWSGSLPPLWSEGEAELRDRAPVEVIHRWCEVVVIGLGEAGRRELEAAKRSGRQALGLDAKRGEEVIGLYPGPLVVARTRDGLLHVHPSEEVVVATGAAELQPVAPGDHLAGLMTATAVSKCAAAGIELGRIVAVGLPPEGVETTEVSGEIVRFEGTESVTGIVLRDDHGREQSFPCDTVSLGLGRTPRDALARMGRALKPLVATQRDLVRLVGSASHPAPLPPCPRAGTVCSCSGVQVSELSDAWDRGFREIELLKRATLAGVGACQGMGCLPYLRSFVAATGQELQPPFTARPVARPISIEAVAAGSHLPATPRTALDAEHRRLGARMERSGGWWRAWSYGDSDKEYRAVRDAVSVCDVSTLGKMRITGPDALALVEYLYPVKLAALGAGRCRYALLLNERGYVFDDGLIARHGSQDFSLSFTSAGSTLAESWVRDWAETLDLDVRILNQTQILGAINVTGPLAAQLLDRAGVHDPPAFMQHAEHSVAGIPCQVYRLSFTGELSFELHHSAADSLALWNRLMKLGDDLGIEPHGLETLLRLRLEKGHIIVGQDTLYDSTPRRLGHEWAVHADKTEFIGKTALTRTDAMELDRQLVGLELEGPAPDEGAVLWHEGRYAGFVTSSTDSPKLDKAILLAWLWRFDGGLPNEVQVAGREARRVPSSFYDPDGTRARSTPSRTNVPGPVPHSEASHAWTIRSKDTTTEARAPHASTDFVRVEATRILATQVALDEFQARAADRDRLCLRFAPDEIWYEGPVRPSDLSDPYAQIMRDASLARVWLDLNQAETLLERACPWPVPSTRPHFAQGAIAEIPVKLWLELERVALLVPAPLQTSLARRLNSILPGSFR